MCFVKEHAFKCSNIENISVNEQFVSHANNKCVDVYTLQRKVQLSKLEHLLNVIFAGRCLI